MPERRYILGCISRSVHVQSVIVNFIKHAVFNDCPSNHQPGWKHGCENKLNWIFRIIGMHAQQSFSGTSNGTTLCAYIYIQCHNSYVISVHACYVVLLFYFHALFCSVLFVMFLSALLGLSPAASFHSFPIQHHKISFVHIPRTYVSATNPPS